MKRNLIMLCGLLLSSLCGGIAKAQQAAPLVPDQNPNYMASVRKYAAIADTLNSLQGTTVQNTYKAYDWYEARQERRRQNRAWRHEERLNSGYYDYSPSWGLYGGYSYPYGFGRYGYGNRFYGRGNFGFGIGW